MKEICYCNEAGVEKVFIPSEVAFFGANKLNLFFDGSFNEEGLRDMFEFCMKTEAEAIVTSDYFLLRIDIVNVSYIHNI